MGNSATKQQSRDRPLKKNVHWKTAEPPSTPGKPILVSGDCDTPDVVTIRWDRPKTDGGAPILGYLVEHRRTGSPHWVRAFPNLVPTPDLALSGLEPGWRYQFRITAQNVVGKSESSEVSDPLTVTLQRNAITAPRFNAEMCDTVAIENEKVEFQVSVTGTPSPEINWFKDGFEIFSSRRTKILTENDTSTLIFHETALTDEGEIKCTATNRAGHAVTKGHLRIEAPPKIRLPRNYEDGLIVEADEPIKLKVGIAGRPTPVVCWTHNGEVIYPEDRIEIETTDKNSSLRVLHGRREDRGEYNVRAVNKLGEDNGSVLVTVTARPSPPSEVTVSISLGKSVTLSWNAPDDDGGCKIGNFTVEYFRMGWNMWLKATTTRSLSATLSDLIEGSEYKFRVKAENPYGMSDPSEESRILFIPDPKRGILRPSDTINQESSDALDDAKPSAPRRRRISPMSSSNHSLEGGVGGVTTADKGEQTHMARLRIQKSTVNVQLIPEVFDSDTIARDMSYGSPDPQHIERTPSKELLKRERSPIHGRELLVSTTTVNTLMMQPDFSPLRTRAKSQTPLKDKQEEEKTANVPVKSGIKPLSEITRNLTPSPIVTRNSINNKQDKISTDKAFEFEFDDEELMLPPPPLSLSAPELSAEPPTVPLLKRSVSSTELLYEKAMARFYKAMELDEREQTKRKSTCASAEALEMPQPFQPLPSKRDSITSSIERGLERKSSLRRRLSGEIPDVNITNFASFKSSRESLGRMPSVSPKKSLYPQESLDDPDYLSHVDDDYTDDYTESTASSGESETEKFKRRVREHGQPKRSITEDELDTYHPRNRMTSPYRSADSDQAAEVLTVPYALPNPDFIPKPILKRPSSVEGDSDDKRSKPKGSSKTKTQRNTFSKLFDRKGSSGGEIEEKEKEKEKVITKKVEVEAESVKKDAEVVTKIEPPSDRRDSTQSTREKAKMLKMEMRQSSIEEQKVAIDHYSDLVKEKGNWRTATLPLYLNADDLKKAAAETVTDELEDLNFELQHAIQMPQMQDDCPVLSPSTRVIKSSTASEAVTSQPNGNFKQIVGETAAKGLEADVRGSRPLEIAPKVSDRASSVSSRPSAGSRNSSAVRRTGKTPVEARMASKTRERSTSKSPLTVNRRPLAMKRQQGEEEDAVPLARRTPSVSRPMTPQQELQQQQEIDTKVKSTMSYATDCVLFSVACWVYLFKDARLALPIVLLLVYRHIREHLPRWMVRKTE